MIVSPVTGSDEYGPYWSLRIASGYRAGNLLGHAGGPEGRSVRWRDFQDMKAWAEETGYSFAVREFTLSVRSPKGGTQALTIMAESV